MKSKRRMQEYDGNLGFEHQVGADDLPRARVKTGSQGKERNYALDVGLTKEGLKIIGIREDGRSAQYAAIYSGRGSVPSGKVLDTPATKGNRMELALSMDDTVQLVTLLCQALSRKTSDLEEEVRKLESRENK